MQGFGIAVHLVMHEDQFGRYRQCVRQAPKLIGQRSQHRLAPPEIGIFSVFQFDNNRKRRGFLHLNVVSFLAPAYEFLEAEGIKYAIRLPPAARRGRNPQETRCNTKLTVAPGAPTTLLMTSLLTALFIGAPDNRSVPIPYGDG
jgi:hypothetical protein